MDRNLFRGRLALGSWLLVVFLGCETAWADPSAPSGGGTPSEPPPSSERVSSVPPGASAGPAPLAEPVHLTVESPRPVVIERLAKDGSWQPVCTSPCDRDVPRGETYRVRGRGVRPSHAFMISKDAPQHVTAQIDPASGTVRGLGVAAIIVGFTPLVATGAAVVGGALVLGVVVILVCPFVDALGGDFGQCAEDVFADPAEGFFAGLAEPAALAVLGGGVALGVAGIVMVSTNGKTRVRMSPGLTALLRPGRSGLSPVTLAHLDAALSASRERQIEHASRPLPAAVLHAPNPGSSWSDESIAGGPQTHQWIVPVVRARF